MFKWDLDWLSDIIYYLSDIYATFKWDIDWLIDIRLIEWDIEWLIEWDIEWLIEWDHILFEWDL